MATGTAPTQTTSTPTQHSQHGNANSSSISISNSTGLTVSNLGNYYTAAGTSISNAVWSVYTNYMKPKSFKLR